MKIELRHLRYVIAAAEHGSFRQAAKALAIQESAISRRIRDLEDDIGATLFIRHHGGVDLTYAGQRFLVRARKAISQIAYAAKDVGSIGRGEEGLVRIGIFSSLASGFLAELLSAYDARHSGVHLDFVEGGPNEHIASVQRRRIDVAFLTGDPAAPGCDVAHLWNERVFVACPRHHELADQDQIAWKDLRDRHFIVSETEPGPEIQDYLVKHLTELGHHLSVERHGVGRDNLMQVVALGRGITLTSEATTAAHFPGVVYRPLADEILPFCAIWSPHNDNPALRRLLSLARIMSKRGKSSPMARPATNPSPVQAPVSASDYFDDRAALSQNLDPSP
ncbi:MAG: LysR family transcriptional regulator [Bradyrhizobium sp.]|uniref:LysR family transcriptional regulator n=1 Tax=Bradyrhizobium sp. TaxID=376 RepID=UPI0025B9E38C|nr:LysR family transcriptional regulator [Bradyrhizobium sp.]MCA3576376.1 LysR family transcriptional regulator [Bradyrhizobium sp.]